MFLALSGTEPVSAAPKVRCRVRHTVRYRVRGHA